MPTPINAVYDLGGTGPTTLYSHATGFHAMCWQPIANRLSNHHNIAYDARGHGNTPVDPETYHEEGGLPVVHLFPAFDINAGSDTPGHLFYRGHRHEIEAQYRGASSLGYPQKSYTIEFENNDPLKRLTAYCHEEGKCENQPFNGLATGFWADWLGYMPTDVLVGTVALVAGPFDNQHDVAKWWRPG